MKKMTSIFILLLAIVSCMNFDRDNPHDRNNIDYTGPNIYYATQGTENVMTIKWSTDQQDVKEFIIYRGTDRGQLIEIARVQAGQTSFTDIVQGKTAPSYFYAVKAILSAGEVSERSNIAEGYLLETRIDFPDINLKKAIMDAIGKSEGDLYLRDVGGLSKLDASKRGISNLTGIEHLTALEQLDLKENAINDITPLSELTGLKVLGLYTNRITDITPLANLTQLTHLGLMLNNIKDISILRQLTNLKELALTGNIQITSIEPLSALQNLTTLHVNGLGISDVSALPGKSKLKVLYLDRNNISNIDKLSEFTELTTLFIGHNQITDITALSQLTQLKILNADKNDIRDISSLQNLNLLEVLSLDSNNRIANIDILSNLTNLRILNLAYIQATDLTAISGLEKLKKLTIVNYHAYILQPLIDNKGFAKGDELILPNDYIFDRYDQAKISTLKARGVIITKEAQ